MSNALTIDQDKAIRLHLAQLAKELRHKFTSTTYQGDYVDTVTSVTYGDRVQVGTQRTIKNVRYLFILNIDIDKNAGGRVAFRVSTWSLDSATGLPAGKWTIRKTYLTGVTLTGSRGFARRIGNEYVNPEMVRRVETYLDMAGTALINGIDGMDVKDVHTRRDGTGEYSTYNDHLLPFGGVAGALTKLIK